MSDESDRSDGSDLIVIGATPAGCAAVREAARAGCSVLLIEPTYHPGGMLSNGLSILDMASPASISGVLKEFADKVLNYYRDQNDEAALVAIRNSGSITYEPKVARMIWGEMLEAFPGLTIRYGMVPVSCSVANGRIEMVHCMPATDHLGNCDEPDPNRYQSFKGDLFIDATYEGDLLAFSGSSFRLGREARSEREPHAGVIYTNYMERSIVSGWLPQTVMPGSTGAADDCVMGVNIRPVVKRYSKDTSGQYFIKKPEGYDPALYDWYTPRNGPLKLPSSYLPNGKFDLNLPLYGNDRLSREIVLAAPHERKLMREECIRFTEGYLYYLQNEVGQKDIGWADDEFVENGNLPEQIYIREGRRLVGRTTLTEANINPWILGDGTRPPLLSDSVAIGDFELDGKTCRRVPLESGETCPEGWFFFRGVRAPFQVPYSVMLPNETGPRNLLVPVCLSCTHVAFTAVRMEPVWIQMGQAAGKAAAMCKQMRCDPGDLDVTNLQHALIQEECALIYFSDVQPGDPGFASVQRAALKGLVPYSNQHQFIAEAPLTKAELAEWLVRCLRLPFSVTSCHYADVPPQHKLFRSIETLYDLATRNGICIFGCERVLERPHFFHLHRHDHQPEHLSHFYPEALVTVAEFTKWVAALKRCLLSEGKGEVADYNGDSDVNLLTRGLFSQWLAQ